MKLSFMDFSYMEHISYPSQFVNIKMRHNIQKKTMISKLTAERILDVFSKNLPVYVYSTVHIRNIQSNEIKLILIKIYSTTTELKYE